MALGFNVVSAGETRGSGLGYVGAIDGLRTLAVLSVVFYHLWPGTVPGGFIGVDIFFVISGFVVTGSLRGKHFPSLGALSAHFYARRLVRIVPALVLMLLAAIVATALFVPKAWLSGGIQNVARGGFLGYSNIVLALGADGYFDAKTDFNPFTHTWSLGVEEQFYLLFPFLIYWHQRLDAAGISARRVVWLVAALSLASLATHQWLDLRSPSLGFYLIVSRFWELGAGMLLCLTFDGWRDSPRLRSGAIGIFGLALVAAALWLPGNLHLGRNLLAVFGTVALLAHVVARGDAPIARLLASRLMVAAGKRSYALYLWHWPVFVMFRWTVGLDSWALGLTALALSAALAVMSYALVEEPIHHSRRIAALPRRRVVALALGGVLVAAGVGEGITALRPQLTLSRTGNVQDWYADAGHRLDPARSHCSVRELRETQAGNRIATWRPEGCAPDPRTVYVIGDSHALAYTPALRQLVADSGVTVRLWFNIDCPPLRLIEPLRTSEACKRYYGTMFQEIPRRAKAGDVIFMPGLRVDRFAYQFDHDRGVRMDDRGASPLAVAQARAVLPRLTSGGARLVMEAPKPVFYSPGFRCADWFNRGNPGCERGLTIDRARMERRRAPIVAAMRELATVVPRMQIWDPLPILCPGPVCEAVPNGRPLFFDTDHLSGRGNDVLYPELKQALLR